MSQSRREQRKKNRQKVDHIDQLVNSYVKIQNKLTPPPSCVPKKAKAVRKLYFPYKAEEDKKEPTSANRKNVAVRSGQNLEDGFYYFKQNKHVSIFSTEASIAECEVVCATWAKFLAPECVPTMRVWYDDDTYEITGRTSKNIPGFVTNHKKPLKEEDTIISLNVEEEVTKEIEIQRKYLTEAINSLLKAIRERKVKEASYIPGMGYLKGFLNRSSAGENGTKHADYLESFLKLTNDVKYSEGKLLQLLQHLRSRGKYVVEYRNDADHKEEFELLKATLSVTDYLLRLTKKTTVPLSAVPILELLYRKACQDGEDLTQGDLERKIEITHRGKKYSITAKHLDNYRIIARQMWQLVARFLNQDPDGHNQNMSRDGWMIDHDMAKLKFLFQFRDSSLWDKLIREPNDSTFVITPYDIENFPAIRDAQYHYWAANKTVISQSVLPHLSWIYTIPANFFGPQDNEVFANLAHNPVAIFHRFKLFLKYALCDEKMYENNAKLHMRTYATFVDKKDAKVKNLLQEMVADEKARIERVREVLVRSPIFQELLDAHGEFLFDMIKEEFKARREKYERKVQAMEAKGRNKYNQVPDTFPFKRMINAIDLDEIEKRYKEIFKQAAQFRNSPEELKKNVFHRTEPGNTDTPHKGL